MDIPVSIGCLEEGRRKPPWATWEPPTKSQGRRLRLHGLNPDRGQCYVG